MSLIYNNNPNVKSAGVSVQFTEEQVKEYVKCKTDPVYFIQNYCKVISLDHGLVPFALYDYQIRFINTIHNENLVVSMQPRQSGKCVEKSTSYRIKSKITGEIREISAEDFHNLLGQNIDFYK